MEKKRPQLEIRKLQMEKLTDKGKHTVKAGSHLHTNMISKPATVRRGEHKCRILKMHLKLKEQELKTILFIYRLLFQNLTITANQKSTIHKQEKGIQHNTNVSHQITRKQQRKIKELGKQIQNNQQNGNKDILIITLNVNGLNAPTKRQRLAGYKNKTHIYVTRDPLQI